jgi:hypothetical protein
MMLRIDPYINFAHISSLNLKQCHRGNIKNPPVTDQRHSGPMKKKTIGMLSYFLLMFSIR